MIPARAEYARDASGWRDYLPHLPAPLQGVDDDLPSEHWWSTRGVEVHLDRYDTAGAAQTVIVVHGAGGYGRLLAPFGRVLARRGARVVLPDLPGYGLTAVSGRSMTYALWAGVLVDLIQAEVERSGAPVRLFGMSMGGMLALHAAAAAPEGSVASLAATTLMDPRDADVRRGVGRFPLPSAILALSAADRMRLPVPLIAPVERMSSIPAINDLVRRDPLGGGNRVPYGFFRSWLQHTQPDAAAFDRCPVTLMHPEADRWTPAVWSRAVLDRIPAPTRYVGLEQCEHFPAEEPGLSILLDTLGEWLAEGERR